jgi:hypothetical protein
MRAKEELISKENDNEMTPYQEFWQWFSEHEAELVNFEDDREKVFDQLAN